MEKTVIKKCPVIRRTASGAGFPAFPVLFLAALLLAVTGCPDLTGGNPPQTRYTITFDTQGGSEVAPITEDEGSPIGKPDDPTWEGYTFRDWYDAATGGTEYSWPYTLAGDVTMYAQWNIKPNETERKNVDDFRNDGTVKEALEKDVGTINLDVTEEELAGIEAKVDAALKAYDDLSQREKEELAGEKAKLDAVKGKIENVNTAHDFQDTYGEVLGKDPDEVVSPEDAASLVSDLAEALEEIDGLPDPVKQLLEEDIARLESLKDKVGEVVAANAADEDRAAAEDFRKTHEAILGKTAETVSVEDEGTVEDALLAYSGLGAVVKALLLEEYEKLTGLKAKIAALQPAPAQQYTITFDSQGGTAVDAVKAAVGTEVAKPGDPTKAGYTFEGWYSAPSGGTLYTWPHTLNADATMYAQWKAEEATPPPALTGTISVTGTAQVGLGLTADSTALNGTGTIFWQWQRGDSPDGTFTDIPGANTATYILVAEDLGKYVRVTASREGYGGTVSSNPTAEVEDQPSDTRNITIGFNYGAITITGDKGTNVIYKNSADPDYLILTAVDYTDVKWYVDGKETPERTGDSITLDAVNYDARKHSITFTGKKNGKLYSQTIAFTVRN
jgi:uncharacterized repeat protein (TIGR02543 family)